MQLWTPQHTRTLLPALAVMLFLCVILRILLKDKPLRIRMIPLQVIAVVLVLLEIGKQAMSFAKGYDLYHIPLHFCSLCLFALPLMAFYRGKHRQMVVGTTVALFSAVFLLTAIYPALIYGAWDIENYFESYFAFHTVTFHNLVMLAFMLMAFLDVYQPDKGDFKFPVIFIGIYCIIAAIAAHALKTNFNNLYSCNIPPLENVRVMMHGLIGYVPTQILYVLIVTCLDMAFVFGAYHFYRLARKTVSYIKPIHQ